MKKNVFYFCLFLALLFSPSLWGQQVIRMKTVLSSGEVSLSVAAPEEDTDIKIDWGDGKTEAHKVGKNQEYLTSPVKGDRITISGSLSLLNCIGSKVTEIELEQCNSLEVLQIAFNFLSAIDVRSCPNLLNLEIFSNNIKSIDLSQNPKLIRLVASGNFISSVDISKCPDLAYFDCARMSRIENVDFSNCAKLQHVIISGCSFSNLKLPAQAPIVELLCSGNKLKELDLTAFDKLKNLDCSENPLTSLKINAPRLETLSSVSTDLQTLDLSASKNLVSLMLKGNKRLAKFDIGGLGYLENLGLSECGLTQLNLEQHTSLKQLWCTGNKLAKIDASKCSVLERLDARNNQLQSISLPESGSLLFLLVAQNNIEKLDLSDGKSLQTLDLGKNKVEKIDFSSCPNLTTLNLRGNPLKELNIIPLTHLSTLGIVECGFDVCTLDKLYEQLPILSEKKPAANLYNGLKGDEAAKTSKTDIAEDKNWTPSVRGDGSGCKDNGIEDPSQEFFGVAYCGNGLIKIITDGTNGSLRIYSIDGELLRCFVPKSEETMVSIPEKGVYMVEYVNCSEKQSAVKKICVD